MRTAAGSALLILLACATQAPGPVRPLQEPLGPVATEVGSDRALLWARADRPGRLHATVFEGSSLEPVERSVPVFRADDWTGRIELRGLRPATLYRYSIRQLVQGPEGERAGPPVEGSFRTAPPDHEPAALVLAFGGDLAGQNVCRDALEGFPIFRTIIDEGPDLFVGLGDMIYADGICRERGSLGNAQVPGAFGPATNVSGFWAHWRYAREDPALAALLASTPYVAVWDDHEVVNDFGPHDDRRSDPPYTGSERLMPLGLAAFLDYNPLPGRDRVPRELHRSLRWGRHLELFVLDTRQHRDPLGAADDAAQPKSMLGAAQRAWLVEALARSDATWKVVVSSVPLSIPTGSPERRDGWANYRQRGGYERELLEILGSLRDADVDHTLWITTDVHFAAVFRYAPFGEDAGFRLHEVATGPLQAGLFRNERFDETLAGERLFLFGPEEPVESFEQARAFFNFGLLEIDELGRLAVRIVNANGESLYRLALEPELR